MRLPTEAQWERACRAESKTKYCNGDTEKDLTVVGWYSTNSESRLYPVGLKKANAWGLHDMHGSVWEWCADWYDAGFYKESKDSLSIDPVCTAGEQKYRVLRGGSWNTDAINCRATYRHASETTRQRDDYGFRLVLPMPE